MSYSKPFRLFLTKKNLVNNITLIKKYKTKDKYQYLFFNDMELINYHFISDKNNIHILRKNGSQYYDSCLGKLIYSHMSYEWKHFDNNLNISDIDNTIKKNKYIQINDYIDVKINNNDNKIDTYTYINPKKIYDIYIQKLNNRNYYVSIPISNVYINHVNELNDVQICNNDIYNSNYWMKNISFEIKQFNMIKLNNQIEKNKK